MVQRRSARREEPTQGREAIKESRQIYELGEHSQLLHAPFDLRNFLSNVAGNNLRHSFHSSASFLSHRSTRSCPDFGIP